MFHKQNILIFGVKDIYLIFNRSYFDAKIVLFILHYKDTFH